MEDHITLNTQIMRDEIAKLRADLAHSETWRDNYFKSWMDALAMLEKVTAERDALREAQRWIPVDERLPGIESEMVLVFRKCAKYSYPYYTAVFDNGDWYANGGKKLDKVTHWRPLPEPPQPPQQEAQHD